MKAKDAYVVGKVEDGHVEWEDGGSTPRKHLLQWNYVSLMREKDDVRGCENVATTEHDVFEAKVHGEIDKVTLTFDKDEFYTLQSIVEQWYIEHNLDDVVDSPTNDAYRKVYDALMELESVMHPKKRRNRNASIHTIYCPV